MYIASGTIKACFLQFVGVIEGNLTSKAAAYNSSFLMGHVLRVHDLRTNNYNHICTDMCACS